MDQTREHLRLLSVFHYVVGGMGCVFSFFPIGRLIFGIVFLAAPEKIVGSANDEFPATLFGVMFTVIPAIIIVCGLALSILIITAGRRLVQCRSHTFCLVMAGIECIFVPFGTVIGVFTIIVLMKPAARQLFGLPVSPDQATQPSPAAPGQ